VRLQAVSLPMTIAARRATNKRVGYLLLPGERGETKLSKARWSETERAKGNHRQNHQSNKKEGDFSPSAQSFKTVKF